MAPAIFRRQRRQSLQRRLQKSKLFMSASMPASILALTTAWTTSATMAGQGPNGLLARSGTTAPTVESGPSVQAVAIRVTRQAMGFAKMGA